MPKSSGGGGSGGRSGGGGGGGDQPSASLQPTIDKIVSGKISDNEAGDIKYRLEQSADHARFVGDPITQKQLLVDANAIQSARDQAWANYKAKAKPIDWNKVKTNPGGPSVRNDDNAGGRRDLTSDFAKRMAKMRREGA